MASVQLLAMSLSGIFQLKLRACGRVLLEGDVSQRKPSLNPTPVLHLPPAPSLPLKKEMETRGQNWSLLDLWIYFILFFYFY